MPPSPAEAFTALRCHSIDKAVQSRFESIRVDDLSPGELVVRTRFAGVNYKDALAVTGRARIVETFPRVPGIELVGDVVSATSDGFAAGDTVIVHGFRTGIAFDGGFAPWARVPAAHAMRLPAGLDAREAAVIGVPGFTAALCLDRFEQLGITPASGPIAVDGATGAVGMLAIAILARAGYDVVASTRKRAQVDGLKALGASDVLITDTLLASTRPLESERFAAAIDNVGGAMLVWLLKSLKHGGAVASVGNAAGNDFAGSVLPFIMRGVQLFGVLANAPWPVRERLWQKLATAWRPDFDRLEPQVSMIAIADVMAHAERQLAGETVGRTLVTF